MSKLGIFFLGAAAGVVVTALLRTETAKKAIAKVIGAGMEIKDKATEYVETVKEGAEDVAAEAREAKEEKADEI